jgi:3-phenylpropionate/cinnamic acid dioxygenase small subunit
VAGTRLLREEAVGSWRLRTNFQVIRTMRTGEMTVFAVGFYDDLLVECADALRFQEKIVVWDASHIDTLLVVPL